jgi:hypothetical protein
MNAAPVEFLHTLEEHFLLNGRIAVCHHARHESAGLGRLCAGRFGGGQNRFRNLIEKGYVLNTERADWRICAGPRPLHGRQQIAAADECHAAEQRADACDSLATGDQIFHIRT